MGNSCPCSSDKELEQIYSPDLLVLSDDDQMDIEENQLFQYQNQNQFQQELVKLVNQNDIKDGSFNLLGQGLSAQVYQIKMNENSIAKKVININLNNQKDEIISRLTQAIQQLNFLQQFNLESRDNQLNILKMYGVGFEIAYQDTKYIFKMSLFQPLMKSNLHQFLKSNEGKNLNLFQKSKIIVQISKALTYFQKKEYIHCDLNSKNVLIDFQNNAFISGLGCLQQINVEPLILYMTAQFGAPENFEFTPNSQSDIWSLGCLIQEIFTGVCPFEGLKDQNIEDIIKQGTSFYDYFKKNNGKFNSQEIENVVKRCADYDHTKRPSIDEIIQIFSAIDAKQDINDVFVQQIIDFQDSPQKIKQINVKYFNQKDIKEDLNKLLGKGAYSVLFRTKIFGKSFAQKVITINLNSLSQEDLIEKLRSLIAEINILQQIAQAQVNANEKINIIKMEGLCMKIYQNEKNDTFLKIAIYQPIMKSDLSVLLNNTKQGSKLSLDLKKKIIYQICQALLYFRNNQLIHCDIKPQNVLLDGQFNVFICDLSSVMKINSDVISLNITHQYAAPEMFNLRPQVKSDLWSLGCLIQEVFTGKKPFQGLSQYKVEQNIKNSISFYTDFIQNNGSFQNKEIQDIVEQCANFNFESRPEIEEIMLIFKNQANY